MASAALELSKIPFWKLQMQIFIKRKQLNLFRIILVEVEQQNEKVHKQFNRRMRPIKLIPFALGRS